MQSEPVVVATKPSRKAVRGIFEKKTGSGVWWVRFMDASGCYRRELAGTLSAAQHLLHKRKDEALKGIKLPELRKRATTFGELVDDAIEYAKKRYPNPTSDLCRLKLLKATLGNRAAGAIKPMVLEHTLDTLSTERKWTPATRNRHHNLILLTYRLGILHDKVSENPARKVQRKTEPNGRVRWLSEDEEKRLQEIIARDYPSHLPEFTLSIHTGLRRSSLYSLTWEMVDWSTRMLNLPTSKNGLELHLPLNAASLGALRTLRDRGDGSARIFQVHTSRHWFEAALKAAGIENFHWHDLRHHFASRLRQKGASLADIAELLGHRGLAMTLRYAHLGPAQLHAVVAALDTAIPETNSTPVAPEHPALVN